MQIYYGITVLKLSFGEVNRQFMVGDVKGN